MGDKQLILALENTNIAVKVVPNFKDANLLVLKASNVEAGPTLLALLGIKPTSGWKGGTYFLTSVNKAAFLEAMSQRLAALIDPPAAAVAKAPESYPVEVIPAPKALGPGKCAECGSPDGLHWNFCPIGKH